MLESLGKDIFDEIESMIVGLSAMDEEYRQRFTGKFCDMQRARLRNNHWRSKSA